MNIRIRLLTLILLFCCNSFSLAEDTDIFLAAPVARTANPNVLIILDNSANWSGTLSGSGRSSVKKFDQEITAIQNILGSVTDVNIGLMMVTKQGSDSGGYVRSAISSNLSDLSRLVGRLNVNSDKTSGDVPYGAAMFEAYKYFGGGDTSTVPPASIGSEGYGPLAYIGHRESARDSSAFVGTSDFYDSPITDACQKNYIIVISNGLPPANSDSGSETLLSNVGGNSTSITLPSSRATSSLGDEYARFLYNTDVSSLSGKQNVITYTIAVYKEPIGGQDPNNVILMKSMAAQGHGRYFDATDASSLDLALSTIFNEIQAVNSVFASVTLPVSVNVRGTNLNQVYLGVFRPDANNLPLWNGNFKQYQLSYDSDTRSIFLADSLGNRAESLTTGFVADDAVSYWTSSSSYWGFSPSGNPVSSSDSPDGAVVEKGGTAQVLREDYATSQSSRKVYTCTSSCLGSSGTSLSGYPFNTSTINPSSSSNQALFGAADRTELEDIINWTRGMDNKLDENIDGSLTDVRSTVHADVLHSRPALINYNRNSDDNDVVAFYGSNDGLFRAVQGGKGSDGGEEKWAVVFEEFFSDLKRYRDNNVTASTTPRPYFADGSVGSYQLDVNGDGKLVAADGDKVYLYISMRRGGRYLYALDVSDPDAPKFLWRKNSSSTGYGELGQTWSKPEVATINFTSDPVLFFGGGYDPTVEDDDPVNTSNPRTMGRAIFAVDGTNGDVIWQVGPSPSGARYNRTESRMAYAIPSDVTLIDRDSNGKHDRIYVGDTGGIIWRVDIDDSDPSRWAVNQLATVGYANSPSKNERRKFLFPPDVVFASSSQTYDTLLIGSGDREHPFNGLGSVTYPLSDAVTNHFYMIKDYSTGLSFSGFAHTLSDLYDATANSIQDGSAAQQAIASTRLDAADGAYIILDTGEKVVSSAVTLSETVYFNTNIPGSSSTCSSNLGEARQYRIKYTDLSSMADSNNDGTIDGDDRNDVHPGGGFLPSPVSIVVQIDDATHEAVCSGVSCEKVSSNPLNARYRTFWHKSID